MMFSGIVQNQAVLIKKLERSGQMRLVFRLRKKEKNLKAGESIAVEGTCLTAAKAGEQHFEADVLRETLQATTLGNLRTGDPVNIERSLKTGDSIGGHFVTGHVDARGRIKKIEKKGRQRVLEINVPKKLARFLAVKGSIAVDGISLTIQGTGSGSFKAAIIPFTLCETTLGNKKAGDWVNLEIDLIARYLKVLNEEVKTSAHSRLGLGRLRRQGF